MKILREVLIKTTLRHFSFIRLAKLQTFDNLLCWWGSGETGCLRRCWWDCRTQDSTTENLWTPKKTSYRDFPGGLMVKNPPCNAGHVCLIPHPGTKILCAAEKLSPQLLSQGATERDPTLWNIPRDTEKIPRAATETQHGEREKTAVSHKLLLFLLQAAR